MNLPGTCDRILEYVQHAEIRVGLHDPDGVGGWI